MGSNDMTTYRALLYKRLERASGDSALSVRDIFEHYEVRPDSTDMATMESDRDFNLLMRERNLKHITEIREALRRIDEGTYGICEECGEDIGAARLMAHPMATLCVHCQSALDRARTISY